jgi:hypothetical protein
MEFNERQMSSTPLRWSGAILPEVAPALSRRGRVGEESADRLQATPQDVGRSIWASGSIIADIIVG